MLISGVWSTCVAEAAKAGLQRLAGSGCLLVVAAEHDLQRVDLLQAGPGVLRPAG